MDPTVPEVFGRSSGVAQAGAVERFPFRLLHGIAWAEMATSVEVSMIFIALPQIVRRYGDASSAFWVITIYYLVATASVTLSARLGDLFGRKRILILVLAVSLCGSAISGLSSSFALLLIGRGITGVVSSATPLALGLIREHFPQCHLATGIAVAMAVQGIVSPISLVASGLLIDHFAWRWLFAVSAAVVIMALITVHVVIPSDRQALAARKIDWAGGLLMVPAIAGLLGTITLAKIWGWAGAIPLSILALSLSLLAFWTFHELRQADPLVDVRLLKQRQLGLANAAVGFLALGPLQCAAPISLLLQQPQWTHAGFGASATLTGLSFLPNSLISFIGGPWSGRIAARHGARWATLVGGLICCSGWAAAALNHGNVWLFLSEAWFGSLGFGILYSAIPNLIVEDSPAQRTSETIGITTTIRLLASGVGSQVVAFMLGWATIAESSNPLRRYSGDFSFTAIFWMFAGSAALVTLIACALPSRSSLPSPQ